MNRPHTPDSPARGAGEILRPPEMSGEFRPCRRNIRVLMYHAIVDDEGLADRYWTALHVDRFRRHLELIDRWGFTPITFRDYRLCLDGRLTLPARPVILTFDDGYLSTWRHAVPLLREFGMTAVFFLLGDRRIRTNYWDTAHGWPEMPLVGSDHVLGLQESGFEIGSHSLSHHRLSALPEDKAWLELLQSRMQLELTLGEPIMTFAYPYGAITDVVKRLAREAGYDFACGVSTGPPEFAGDTHDIMRIPVHHRVDTAGFALRLFGPYPRLLRFRRSVGRAVLRRDRTGGGPAQPVRAGGTWNSSRGWNWSGIRERR